MHRRGNEDRWDWAWELALLFLLIWAVVAACKDIGEYSRGVPYPYEPYDHTINDILDRSAP